MLTNRQVKKGQSLWEVIISLAIASLVALGLVRVTSSAVKSTRFSGDQSQMTALGQKKANEALRLEELDPKTFWADVDGLARCPGLGQLASCQKKKLSLSEDWTAAKDSCVVVNLYNFFLSLPTQTPNWIEAKMAYITVDISWNLKGSVTDCTENNFNHTLRFNTYVTN